MLLLLEKTKWMNTMKYKNIILTLSVMFLVSCYTGLLLAHGNEVHFATNIQTNIINLKTGEMIQSSNSIIQPAAGKNETLIHTITLSLGITLFVLLTTNIILGFLRFKQILPWKMKLHKWLAIFTWVVALTHGILAIFF